MRVSVSEVWVQEEERGKLVTERTRTSITDPKRRRNGAHHREMGRGDAQKGRIDGWLQRV